MDMVPNMDVLNLTGSVNCTQITLCAGTSSSQNIAFRWWANLTIPSSGVWTFFLSSNIGSNFYIWTPGLQKPSSPFINNDGSRPSTAGAVEQSSSATFTAGTYWILVEYIYLTSVGSTSISVSWQAQGGSKATIPAANLKPLNPNLVMKSLAPPVIWSVLPQNLPSTGNVNVTILGYNLGGDRGSNYPLPTISVFYTQTQESFACVPNRVGWNATQITCLLPPGQGQPIFNYVHSAFDGGAAAIPLPRWPDDMFFWNWNSVSGQTVNCLKIDNSLEPGGHTWGDNWYCSLTGTANLRAKWSQNGPIAGMNCAAVTMGTVLISGVNEGANWLKTYYCLPPQAPYSLLWSQSGALNGYACSPWREGSDPYWNLGKTFMCAQTGAPYGGGSNQLYIYAIPTITSLTPNTGPTVGGINITVQGQNFGTGGKYIGTLTIGYKLCTIYPSTYNHTYFVCQLASGEGPNAVTVAVWSQSSVASFQFWYLPPNLTSMNPTFAATSAGVNITIAGTNFGGTSGYVTVGTANCPVLTWNDTQVVCALAPGQGANLTVTVTTYWNVLSSNSLIFSFNAPVVTSISPSNFPTVGGTTVIIKGTSFGLTGVAQVGGNLCVTLSWSHLQISCQLPAGMGRTQPINVTVQGQTNNPLAVTFNYDAPIISTMVPLNSTSGNGDFLTLTGTSFGTTGTILIGTQTCLSQPAQYSHTRILCAIPTGFGYRLSTTLTVASQSATSPSLFTYYPTITSISTPSGVPTAGGVSITLNGKSYASSIALSTVTVGGTSCPVTFSDSTSVVCTLPPGKGALQSVSLTISGLTAPVTTIDFNQPVVLSVNPTSGSTQGNFSLTVTGTDFSPFNNDTTVTVGGALCAFQSFTTTLSGSTVVCTVPPGYGINQGVQVSVGGYLSNTNVTFSYNAPSLSTISPTNGPIIGGIPVTLQGSDFAPTSGSVLFGSNVISIVPVNQSTIVFTLPAGQGQAIVLVRIASQSSVNALTFTYDPAIITALSISSSDSSGGVALTVTGNNFGPTDNVYIGGVQCPPLVGGVQNSSVYQCVVPAGSGLANPVVVSGFTTSNTLLFDYNPPRITDIFPGSGPTAGGNLLIINGFSFFTSGTVTLGGQPCSYLLPGGTRTHTKIICGVPAGEGTDKQVIVCVGTQCSTDPITYDYQVPVIAGIDPSTGPTDGGTTIDLRGSNFGFTASVTVGGNPCTPSSFAQTHTQFECVTPPGQGANVPVILTVAGQSSAPFFWSYAGPAISTISPLTGPASGGTTIVLTGINFGQPSQLPAPIVTFKGVQVTINQLSHTTITFNTLPGTGKNVPITLSVTGRVANYTGGTFNYAAPTIDSANGCTEDVYPAAKGCDIFGTSVITIVGTNFGSSSAVVSVTTGGDQCVVTAVSDTAITCNLPARAVGGFNLAVNVTVDGQSANASLVSYAGPVLTAGTLVGVTPVLGPAGSITLPNTDGGQVIQLTGGFWGTNQSLVSVRYGRSTGGTIAAKEFSCPLVGGSLQSTGSTSTLECTAAAGVGQNLVFMVQAGLQVSQESVDVLNYPTPYIVPTSIRLTFAGTGDINLPGLDQNGDKIYFDAGNLGNRPDLIQVYYSQDTSNFVTTCLNLALTATGISCTTQPGFGNGYKFRILANGVWSNISDFTYDYFPTPEVDRVWGCSNTGNETIDCPTAGGTLLTLAGRSFAATSIAIRVGGSACSPVIYQNSTMLYCYSPSGTGTRVQVEVFIGSQFSPSVNLVSYTAPVINSITGCTDRSDGSTYDCARTGSVLITLSGQNFGPASPPAIVIVGSKSCDSVTHDPVTPNELLRCTLPAGITLNTSVVFRQALGSLVSLTQTVSYAQCGVGAYLNLTNQVTCDLCPSGSYNDRAGAQGVTACKQCDGGTSSVAGQSSCTQCTRGKYSVRVSGAGVALCSDCAAGLYQNQPAQLGCAACPPGTYSNSTASTSCDVCPTGSFNLQSGLSICSTCLAGQYSPNPGSVGCSSCPSGTASSNAGSATCSTCIEGSYSTGATSTCTECVPGSYIDSPGQAACKLCDPGKFSNSSSLSSCYSCAAGSAASGTGSLTCAQCVAGQYIGLPGQPTCLGCVRGEFNNQTGSSACTKCAAGYYSNSAFQTVCTACEAGKYGAQLGFQSCDPCPPGSYSVGTNNTVCAQCHPGLYQSVSGATVCVQCPAGQLSQDFAQPKCVDCDAGKYGNDTGMSSCFSCPPGNYSRLNSNTALTVRGATSCLACDVGSYSPFTGTAVCPQCEVGLFQPLTGQSVCSRCPAGTLSSRPGALSCTNCSAGYFTRSDGSFVCTPCGVGTYSEVSGATQCFPCDLGTYQPGTGLSVCEDCELGLYAAATGQVQCDVCPSGQFSNTTKAQACQLCPAGSYQSSSSAVNCKLCGPGLYTSVEGSQVCVECAIGSYANSSGAMTCDSCSAGTIASAPGATACTDCLPGTFVETPNAPLCFSCPVGTFSSSNGATYCLGCTPGFAQNASGKTGCEPCRSGSALSATGQAECVECEAGRFTAAPGALLCDKCAPGKYSSQYSDSQGVKRGVTECENCGIGFYTPDAGQPSCRQCPLGTFANVTGLIQCALCPPGTFMTAQAATACTQCAVGYFSNADGSFQCSACPAGRYAQGLGSSECLDCSAGTYQPDIAQTVCVDCEVGRSTPLLGAKVCSDCAPGKATNATGQGNCAPCAPGSYQSEEGQTECLLCGLGTSAPDTSTISCTPCAPGTYSNSIGQQFCTDCSPGYYIDLSAQQSCLACPVGKEASAFHSTACAKCPDRTVAPFEATALCLPCEMHAVADDLGVQCLCDVGYAANGTTCLTCPEGAWCKSSGLQYASLETLEGWWEQNSTFYRCLQQRHCPGGADSPCAANRVGPLCAYCKQGYEEAIGGSCDVCTGKGGATGLFVMAAILILAALLIQYYILLNSGRHLMKVFENDERWRLHQQELKEKGHQRTASASPSATGSGEPLAPTEGDAMSSSQHGGGGGKAPVYQPRDTFDKTRVKEKRRLRLKYNINRFDNILTVEGAPSPKADFTFKLKIVVSFVQIVTNLGVGLEIQWPKGFQNFVSFFNPANLDLVQVSSVQCVQTITYYEKVLAAICVPPLVVLALCLFFLLPNYLRFKNDDIKRKISRKEFWKLLLFTLFLIYPYCASTVLRLFICKDILGTRYLLADMTVECDTAQWRLWSLICGLMIPVYPFGIPAFFFFMIFRYRKRLHEAGIRAELGILYDAYPLDTWWFEMADMIHKLFVTSVLAFIPQESQLPVGITVVALYLIVILTAKPYLRKSDDRLHLVAQTEILLYLCAGHVFANSPVLPGTAFDDFMSFVLIVMMLTFLAYVVLQGLQAAKKMYHDRKYRRKVIKKDEQDRFFGVQRDVVDITSESTKASEYMEKPFIDTVIPGTWWAHWPLRKFARYRPRPVDQGRGLLRGLYAIDRRTLEHTLNFADDGMGMEGITMEETNPLSESTRGLLSSEASDQSSRARGATTSKQAELRARLGPDVLDAIAEDGEARPQSDVSTPTPVGDALGHSGGGGDGGDSGSPEPVA